MLRLEYIWILDLEIAVNFNQLLIINLSIITEMFDHKWKIAKLILLYKGKGNGKLKCESYRPVSLLPIVAKIVKKVTQAQIVKHMEEN